MPKIRERAPMDKVKTKGATNPKQKKNPTPVSRQIEKAAKEKAEQRREQEASNESAVTTTEQAAIDVAHKAGEITGNVASPSMIECFPGRLEAIAEKPAQIRQRRNHLPRFPKAGILQRKRLPNNLASKFLLNRYMEKSGIPPPRPDKHRIFLPPCSPKPEKCKQKTFQTVQWSKGAGWPFKNTDKPRWKKRRKSCLSCLLIHSHNPLHTLP